MLVVIVASGAILWQSLCVARQRTAVALCLLCMAGCGGGDEPSSLKSAPWGSQFVREQVICDGDARVSVAFTGNQVTVSRGEDALAFASQDGRSLGGDCEEATVAANIRGFVRLSAPVYEVAEVVCRVTGRVAIQAHPIMESGRPNGTTLLVFQPGRGELLASAPLKDGGSRLYYDTTACRRSS